MTRKQTEMYHYLGHVNATLQKERDIANCLKYFHVFEPKLEDKNIARAIVENGINYERFKLSINIPEKNYQDPLRRKLIFADLKRAHYHSSLLASNNGRVTGHYLNEFLEMAEGKNIGQVVKEFEKTNPIPIN